MANLKEIRGRIKSITSIQQVTSAMKMVAAAKLRTSQLNMEQCRPYSNEVSNLMNNLLLDCDNSTFALMEKREIKAHVFSQYENRYQIFLSIALICFIIEFFLSTRSSKELGWKGRLVR